jgi:hypothetical protein
MFVTASLSAVGACSKSAPKVGDKCEQNGERVCNGAKTSLFCVKNVYQLDTCNGAGGCGVVEGAVKCDVTGNADGDVCPEGLDGWEVCRADHKSRATCKAGKYVVEACPGDDGCTMTGPGQTTCALGKPKVGSACHIEGFQACAEGDKTLLVCKSEKFVFGQKCPGAAGCAPKGGGLASCDPNGAFVEGDACLFIAEACTDGGKTALGCEAGKLVKKSECPGERGCSPGKCDPGIGKVGERCDEGAHVCSEDGKSRLVCKPSTKKDDAEPFRWAVDKGCRGKCTPTAGKLTCD